MSSERLMELHADRAIWGLDELEETELTVALASSASDYDMSWELAAGLAAYALLDEIEPAPEHLIEKLREDANEYFASQHDSDAKRTPILISKPAPARPEALKPARSPASMLGWYLAAAALVLVSWLGWDRFGGALEPSAERVALLTSSGAIQVEWQAVPSERRGDPEGDVVWSSLEQRGFMRFRGLPANDPGQFQYQLWIFDDERSDPQPIDGGVFDISDAGIETLVPIDAKLHVSNAVTFAVTIEPPGGVVVSKQEHIVTLAKP